MTEKRWRTVQPAHPSENVTVEQARAAWLKTYGHSSQIPMEAGVDGRQSRLVNSASRKPSRKKR